MRSSAFICGTRERIPLFRWELLRIFRTHCTVPLSPAFPFQIISRTASGSRIDGVAKVYEQCQEKNEAETTVEEGHDQEGQDELFDKAAEEQD